MDESKVAQEASESPLRPSVTCVVKDTPGGEVCRKPKYTVLAVSYTFTGQVAYEFEIPMCEDHANAMENRLQDTDLGTYGLLGSKVTRPTST